MNSNIKDVLINILLFIVLMFLLLVPGYLCYKVFFLDTKEEIDNNSNVQGEVDNSNNNENPQVVEETEPYKEYFPILEDQQAYVIVPGKIDKEESPILIIYSHGSNTTVTQNMDEQFMLDLQEYGKFFTQYNYIFAASNQHGVNWGSEASLRDTMNLIEWVMQNYDIEPKVYMLGFSMGGLPTLNFATANSEMIGKIALLAPTTKISEWNVSRVEKLKGIDIKMWHGNADVNVPYSSGANFVSRIKNMGKEIEFITLQGMGHFDIDTEYMGEILEFFNE